MKITDIQSAIKALAALGGYHDLTTIAWVDSGGTVTCRARLATRNRLGIGPQ